LPRVLTFVALSKKKILNLKPYTVHHTHLDARTHVHTLMHALMYTP